MCVLDATSASGVRTWRLVAERARAGDVQRGVYAAYRGDVAMRANDVADMERERDLRSLVLVRYGGCHQPLGALREGARGCGARTAQRGLRHGVRP